MTLALLTSVLATATPNQIHTEISLDREAAMVHEQIVLTVRVRHPASARANWEAPTFDGFWSERLTTRTAGAEGDMARDKTRVTRFRRALFPTRAGRIDIAPSVLIIRGEDDRRFEIPVAGASVSIAAVPDLGEGPVLVGQIRARAELSGDRIKLGKSARLTVEVFGTGNVWDFHPPDLERALDGSVEVFADPPRLLVGEMRGRATTRRVFRYALVPQTLGRVRIPSIEIPFYDPAAGKHRVARTEPLAFMAVASSFRGDDRMPWENRQNVPTSVRAPIDLWPVVALYIALALGAALYLRRWNRLLRARHGDGPPSPGAAFAAACDALGQPEFPALLKRAVKLGIAERHTIDVDPLTTEEVARRVDDAAGIALLRELDALRFTRDHGAPEQLVARVREYLGLALAS